MKIIPRMLDLTKIGDRRGNLSIVEQFKDVPFEIRRAFWIYDVPGNATRGGHALRETEEFIVALSGSFDVVLNDGEKESVFHLNRSYNGVYVPKMIWREMRNFSTNSLALVVSSTYYSADDYVRDFELFKSERSGVVCVESEAENAEKRQEREWTVKRPSVYDCSVVDLGKHEFDEGNLTVVTGNETLPFGLKRVFYLYDIPGGEARGAHAHKKCHQFLVAASGAFEVVLDDGVNRRTVTLNRPYYGLHIPPGIWAAEQGFSSGSVCLALASDKYEEDDYIRDYEEFLKYRKQ